MNSQKVQKLLYKQPILCPWISSQPYHSTPLLKNRNPTQTSPSITKRIFINSKINKEALLNLSKAHFFYFIRLMQLFPDIHPATIHTVLNLCKNDFSSAVVKLLYAKRYKILYDKRNLEQKLISSDKKCSTIINNNTHSQLNDKKQEEICEIEDTKNLHKVD